MKTPQDLRKIEMESTVEARASIMDKLEALMEQVTSSKGATLTWSKDSLASDLEREVVDHVLALNGWDCKWTPSEEDLLSPVKGIQYLKVTPSEPRIRQRAQAQT